jgi:hypothetical protein
MDLTTREFQMTKTKKYLKYYKISFFFQNSTEKASNWISTEQKVVSLNLNYYKFNALSAQKTLKSSKHRLKSPLISITTAILTQTQSFTAFNKFQFDKISKAFLLLALKINNCIYSTEQFKNLFVFTQRITQLAMYKSVLANIKTKKRLSLSK